jgi:hypothetical protein
MTCLYTLLIIRVAFASSSIFFPGTLVVLSNDYKFKQLLRCVIEERSQTDQSCKFIAF